jgi:phage-related protein
VAVSSNVIDITIKAHDETAAGMESVKKSGSVLTGIFQGIGQKAGSMLADLPGQALGFFKGAIDAASDLGETVSKNQTIFGSAANDLMAWADSAPKALGMTKQAALDATGTLGNLFTQLGIGVDEARKLSQANVQLATDFASFHNADPTEVLEAMTAAYRGEYDAVQRFVPVINAAKVEEEALAMTHKKSTKELTEKDKALAVSALMTKNAGAANGDFARTSDSAANRARIAAASFEEMKVKIGNVLLPAWTALLGFITGSFFPALTQLGSLIGGVVGPVFEEFKGGITALQSAWENFNDGVTSSGFAGWMENLGINARRLWEEFKGGLTALQSAWENFNDGVTSSGFAGWMEKVAITARPIFEELKGGIAAFGSAWQNFEDGVTSSGFAGWMEKIAIASRQAFEKLSEFWTAIKGNENLLITIGVLVGVVLVNAFIALAAAAWSAAAGVIAATWPFLAVVAVIFALVAGLRYAYENWEWFRTGVNTVVQWLIANVPPILEQIRLAVEVAFTWIATVAVPWIQMVFGSFMGFLQGTFLPAVQAVWSAIVGAVGTAVAFVTPIIAFLVQFIEDNFGHVAEIARNIWDMITNIIANAWQIISNIVQLGLNLLTGNWGAAWDNVCNILSAAWNMIQNVVANGLGILREELQGLLAFLGSVAGRIAEGMFNAGRAILEGLLHGFQSVLGSTKDQIASGLSSIRRLFPFSPAKEGPFSGRGWVTYSGAAIAEGLAQGMTSRIGSLANAATAITSAAHPGNSMPVGGQGFGVVSGQLSVAGDTDSAVATMIMSLVRSGHIQLQPAGGF